MKANFYVGSLLLYLEIDPNQTGHGGEQFAAGYRTVGNSIGPFVSSDTELKSFRRHGRIERLDVESAKISSRFEAAIGTVTDKSFDMPGDPTARFGVNADLLGKLADRPAMIMGQRMSSCSRSRIGGHGSAASRLSSWDKPLRFVFMGRKGGALARASAAG